MANFSQLVSKLSKPHVAAITAGVTFSTFFLFGNVAVSGFGVLPYLTSTDRVWPVSEKLTGWKYNFEHGKKYFGGAAALGALSYTAAATLSPSALKTPLWVAAACCYGIGLWTLGIMKNTNTSLTDLQRSTAVTDAYVHQSDVDKLVSTWKKVHNVRIGLGVIAYGCGMASLLLAV